MKEQIEGKNRAIHAYDGMIWRVRAGVLTLLFAGWGILLSSLASNDVPIVDSSRFTWVFTALWALSLSLALGGFLVDVNYVRRKFRVIHAMRLLFAHVSEDPSGDFEGEKARPLLEEFLDISGDSGSRDYLKVLGYRGAFRTALLVYLFPLAGVTIAGALVYFGFR